MQPEGSLPHTQAPPPVRFPSQNNPFHVFPSNLLKMKFNILLSTLRFSKWSLSLIFTLYASRLPPIHTTWPAQLILLDLMTRIAFSEEYRALSSSLCCLFHSPVNLSLLGPKSFLGTLFSSTLSLRSPLNVIGQDNVSAVLLCLLSSTGPAREMR